jgi:hypothetical protein
LDCGVWRVKSAPQSSSDIATSTVAVLLMRHLEIK